jgi:hypothetical protein
MAQYEPACASPRQKSIVASRGGCGQLDLGPTPAGANVLNTQRDLLELPVAYLRY